MPRIIIPDDHPPLMVTSGAWRKLARYDVSVSSGRPLTSEDLLERIRSADIVINIRATSRFTANVLAGCPNLRLISIWGAGTDHVDLQAARECGICVTNTPGVAAIAVAEHAVSLMMAAAKQTIGVDRQVRAGSWPRGLVSQLHGKTLGLIGTGAIGREVARLGKAIGMHVVAWTFHPSGDFVEWVPFEDVFRRGDVVSVHVRQSPDTTGLIRREHFEMMKSSSIFINTARGAIVREQDLVEALRSRSISAAGLDVFETEPLPPDSPFFTLPNVVLSPHSAGITPEAIEAGLQLAIENVFSFLDGKAVNVVC